MRRSFLVAALGAPILFSLALMGCGRPVDVPDNATSNSDNTVANPGSQAALLPLRGTVGAVLHGKVTLVGSPEVAAKNKELADQMIKQDKGTCYDQATPEEQTQQQWLMDGQGGVGNVVVWLQPPEGYYFAVDPKDKTWPDTVDVSKPVELSQPHCAFKPHVTWIVPEVPDPTDPTKPPIQTGQKFEVSNLAPVSHNTNYESSNSSNSRPMGTLKANTAPQEVHLKGNNALVRFSCNIHPWMDAYIWVFNHPYVAVTDIHGDYTIKNVPAGSKVRLTAWHEKGPYNGYLAQSKIKGDEIELKEGDNVHDFTLPVGAK